MFVLVVCKRRKGFLKANDCVKYSLQNRIIYTLHGIELPIAKYYITGNFDDGNGGVNTELSQKVILQLYVHELHIDMLNKYANGFSMEYYE